MASLPEETTTLHQMAQLRDAYYKENGKNTIFKNKQKFDCAEVVLKHIPMDTLIKNTFWIVPGTNKVYFEYPVFKQYATPENYIRIVDEVLKACSDCVSTQGKHEVHVNLDTFTISAAHRYKDIITLFCDECLRRETHFTERLDGMHLYNTPKIIDNISALLMPLIPPEVRPKIRMYGKQESGEMIKRNMEM
jgi:hypothetical protein